MAQPVAQVSSLSRERERARVRARALRESSTDAERTLWNALRNRHLAGYKFRRQHPLGAYFADFACIEAGLAIELDGVHRFEPVVVEKDQQRTLVLRKLGFEVLRFDDRQILTEQAGDLTAILDWLTAHHPHPNPLPPAGEGAQTKQGASS